MRAIKQQLSEAEKRLEARVMQKRGCSLATICTTLKVCRKWLREVLGLPPDVEKMRPPAPTFDDVPSLPSHVAKLLSLGHEPTTPEAEQGMADYIEAACAELRKRQQDSPSRQPAAEIPRVKIVVGNVRGGLVSL